MDQLAFADVKTSADELYGRGDFAAAAAEYRKLVDAQPANAQAAKALALSLAQSGSVDEAVDVAQRAATLAPMDPECRYAYGYALGAAKRYEDAIVEMDAAVYLQPNHVPAKQGLIYCLINASPFYEEEDLVKAEGFLDRALKLDPKNAHLLAALLDFQVRHKQVGKAIKLYQSADASIQQSTPMQPVVAKMQADDAFATAFRQAQVAQQAAPKSVSAPAPQQQTLQQVPCPNCRQMIMSYAAICPHCNFKNRETGTFAGRDRGPDVVWQEVAYMILAAAWLLLAAYDTFKAIQIKDSGFRALMATYGSIRCGIGIGLLLKIDWVAFLAKIMCYLMLGIGGYMTMISFGIGDKLAGSLSLLTVAIAGFMVYLINFVCD